MPKLSQAITHGNIIIILEGIDKSGKSTIANFLKEKFGFEIVKCSQPKGDAYKEYVSKLNKVNKNTVFDRFCYGELVYGPLYRGKSQIDNKKLANIETLASAKNAIIIYCYDKPELIAKRFNKDKKSFT